MLGNGAYVVPVGWMTGTLIIMVRLLMVEPRLIMIIVLNLNIVLFVGVHGTSILGSVVASDATTLTAPGATTSSTVFGWCVEIPPISIRGEPENPPSPYLHKGETKKPAISQRFFSQLRCSLFPLFLRTIINLPLREKLLG